jgi:hypothetical protein
VVVAEAVFSMQGDRAKHAGIAEAARLLRPGADLALVADEGFVGAARFVGNVLTNRPARRRIWAMRQAFAAHRRHLVGLAIVARKR